MKDSEPTIPLGMPAPEMLLPVIEHAPMAIAVLHGSEHRFLLANAACRALQGDPEKPVLGCAFAEAFPEIATVQRMQVLNRIYLTGETISIRECEARLGAEKNTSFWDVDHVPYIGPDGTVAAVMIIANEVTERVLSRRRIEDLAAEAARRAREALQLEAARRQDEARLRLALSAAGLGEWEVDPQSGKVWCSAEVYALFGLDSSESVSSIEHFFSHIHPDDIDEARTIWARARDGEKEVQIQLRVVWPDGSEHWLFSRGERAFNSSRDIMTMRGVIMDITDLKQGEQALRDSEEWFRTLAEALPEIVWSASPEGNTIYSNARWTEYTGLPRDAALDGQWRDIIHCDDLPRTLEAWKTACMARKPYQIEHRFRHRSGYYHWFLTRAIPVKDAAGRVMKWYGTATDIDDQKRAEQELSDHSERLEELVRQRTVELEASHQRLRLSDRMAALGTLSAGLGHDMGNLLLPLRVRLDSLEARGLTPELHEDVAAMRKSAEYLQRLTNGLRLLALDPEDAGATGEEVCLRDWWADVEALLRNTLPRTVTLTYAVAPETPPVRLARHRLTQAVFNLVQNAGEAMRECDHGAVRIWARPEGDESVVLSIADNGPGMTPEVRRRCIEPFFTTKTRELSTGLGLALVNGIVQASGGRLAIDTAPGMGTTFHLSLPAAIRAVRRVRPLAMVSLTDARMRSFVASVLRGLEYDVTTGGQTAPGPPIQLWVTDGDQICGEYLERFTREGGGRVVLFGECRVGPRGIIRLGSNPKPAAIRQALREATREGLP